MQALLETTRAEVPKSLVDMEIERLVASARADLQARGLKMENVPIDPQLFEDQAKRRVALGLIVAEVVKRFDLAAKPEQVRKLVEEHADSYEQPSEVVKWFYYAARPAARVRRRSRSRRTSSTGSSGRRGSWTSRWRLTN